MDDESGVQGWPTHEKRVADVMRAADALAPKPGVKYDEGKPKWSLMPWEPLSQVVDVLTFGARKYSDDGWKHVSSPRSRYFSAAMRHMVAWRKGQRTDPESGIHPLAHAACCLLFCIWFDDNEDGKTKVL